MFVTKVVLYIYIYIILKTPRWNETTVQPIEFNIAINCAIFNQYCTILIDYDYYNCIMILFLVWTHNSFHISYESYLNQIIVHMFYYYSKQPNLDFS